MKELIVYISITSDRFPSVSRDLMELQTATVRIADLDQLSSREVIHTAREAIDLAESLTVIVHVQDDSLEISPLFPILKRCVSSKIPLRWFQVGNHASLTVFRKKCSPHDFENIDEAIEFMRSQIIG